MKNINQGSNFKKNEVDREKQKEERLAKIMEDFKIDTIRDGKLRRVRENRYYEKPSAKRRRKLAESKAKAKQNSKRRRRQGSR